jgi:hypothetical protein
MDLIADGLLIATAMTAGLYCMVLSRRLRRLTESGDSIGPQIEALDQALGDTRAALAETREGVSELRASTKAVIAKLASETARGEDIAELIERGVGEAKATMQRLYEAADRIEAHESRSTAGASLAGEGDPDGPPDGDSEAGAGEEPPTIETQSGLGDDPPIDWVEESAEPAGGPGEADSAAGPKVALPEGKIVASEVVASVAPHGAASERTGSILKAERVVL